MDKNYKIYHVTRNLAKHSFELDDALYGSPLEKKEQDWAVVDPKKYLQKLKEEYDLLDNRLDDFMYVLRRKGLDIVINIPEPDKETADSHIYHRFTDRSFNYLEKIVYLLTTGNPDDIEINKPKAVRQVRAIEAALCDIKVSMTRFEVYAKSQNP